MIYDIRVQAISYFEYSQLSREFALSILGSESLIYNYRLLLILEPR